MRDYALLISSILGNGNMHCGMGKYGLAYGKNGGFVRIMVMPILLAGRTAYGMIAG
jgi:hypothetical protein